LEVEGFKQGLMEILGSPGGDRGTGVDKDFHQADQASAMNFDSGDFGLAGDDAGSQTSFGKSEPGENPGSIPTLRCLFYRML
jgi:hypothetical protein